MPRYRVAGVHVAIDRQLPELVEAAGEERPRWSFEQTDRMPVPTGEVLKEEVIDDRVWMRIFRAGKGFAISFPEVAEFCVSPGERSVDYCPAAGTGDSTLRHVIIDLVIPYLLAMDGSLVLHASAVATDHGAVVFAGVSGCGKSSLAAEFARRGDAVMADDFVLFRERGMEFVVLPAYPGLRLWPDSAEALAEPGSLLGPVYDGGDKQRVVSLSLRGGSEVEPLAAIVLLGDQPERHSGPVIESVPARAGMMELFGQAFRMERVSGQRAIDEFDRFARLANSTRLFRLSYQRDYAALPSIRELVVKTLRQPSLSGPPGTRTQT